MYLCSVDNADSATDIQYLQRKTNEKQTNENHRQKRVAKSIFHCYLAYSTTPAAWAGLVPYTPSQRDGQAWLWHSEGGQKS